MMQHGMMGGPLPFPPPRGMMMGAQNDGWP
jgi:hypothetical protein